MFKSLRNCIQLFKFQIRVRTKYTGDLMTDFGWDEQARKARCKKEAECKKLDGSDKLKGKYLELDECEEKNLGVLDPTPEPMRQNSLAIIKRRPKMVTQQGTNNAGHWELYFDTKERWENPTMGWASSGYPFSNLRLKFTGRDQAVAFARSRGWRYQVDDESAEVTETCTRSRRKFKPSQDYASNFHWCKRTRVSTK